MTAKSKDGKKYRYQKQMKTRRKRSSQVKSRLEDFVEDKDDDDSFFLHTFLTSFAYTYTRKEKWMIQEKQEDEMMMQQNR